MDFWSRLRPRARLREWVFACNRSTTQRVAFNGFDLVEEDWDIAIILDACRFDMMKEIAPSSWSVGTRISPGSESWEFMQHTFVDKKLHDTVYITSNPHAEKLPDGIFHSVENVLETHWDPDLQTVPPEEMAMKTIEVAKEYPNKRIISHWMQPHFPFIGETGQKISHRGINDNSSTSLHVWSALMERRQLNRKEVIKAYNENLEVTLPHVEKVIENVIGKVAVTSDHGNLLGETMLPVPVPMYGHPRGIRKQELITVPWIEIESSHRRTLDSEPPLQSEQLDDRVIKDRLESLGYR